MKRLIYSFAGTIVLVIVGLVALCWFSFRVYVPPNQCAFLIRKHGKNLPPNQIVATEPGQKGIQPEALGPGRYFYNPLVWDYTLTPLTVVDAGDPSTWEWVQSLSSAQVEQIRAGTFRFKGKFPQIGIVTRKIGKPAPPGQVLVSRESGQQGMLREVLTPGIYKLNPMVYEVEMHDAVVIPAGFVGVVTNLLRGAPSAGQAVGQDADLPEDIEYTAVRALSEPGQRGTQLDVLQPGVYFIHPKLQKITLIEIGYNEYSQIKVNEDENLRISFPSDTGYLIRVGVTVVWGIHPMHAAEIINEFGNVDAVLDKVIGPQLRSICRNIGSTYAARDFIHGEKREQFQNALTAELKRVCGAKNVEILLALVREIEVHAPTARAGTDEVTEDLKRTIQQSYLAIENRITTEKQRDAAIVRAQLEEIQKQIEIAREETTAETRVLVAQIRAQGEKEAAEVDAQAQLEVATIQQQVALLDAKRTEILGQASADVEKMKNAAQAEGYKLLIDAFGSPSAYNLYTFAQNFKPESIRLFYAGEGTFWTDLSRFEEVGAAKVLQRTPTE